MHLLRPPWMGTARALQLLKFKVIYVELVGTQVGPYHLQALIGRGGTAEVYKALHPALGRQVAIKILLSETSQDPDWVRRFRREAQLLGQLDHPHILPIFDAGEDQGRPYLVMKYITDGVTLRSLLDGEPWPLERAVHVIDQVAEALNSAHEAGVVHRDIKPSNILVTPEHRCLVFDFGIAKPLKIPSFTDEGFVVGTPEFMSPEQCRGEKIDHRSDLYSLGIMTYQLLTGQVPFKAESAVGVLMKHLTAPLPIPPEHLKLNPEVCHVLTCALARSPDNRYASVMEFNEKLHEAAGCSPTITIAAKALKQPLRKARLRRLQQIPQRALALAGTLALALGLGSLLLGYQHFSSTDDGSTGAEIKGAAQLSESWVREETPSPTKNATAQPPDSQIQTAPPLKLGFLSIESDRPATVLLDGQFIGNAPGEFKSLPPGHHQLKLNGSGGVVWERDISIYAASTTYVRTRFAASTAAQNTSAPRVSKPVTDGSVSAWETRAKTQQTTQTPSKAPIRRWQGYLTDERCRELGGHQGELHLKSALRCIRESWRPMLYAENGQLDDPECFERVRLIEGAPWACGGRLDGETNTIHVVR